MEYRKHTAGPLISLATGLLTAVMTVWLPLSVSPVQAASVSQDARASRAFAPLSVSDIRDQLLGWLAQAAPDEATARKITELWADAEGLKRLAADELLDRIVESLALADPAVQQLVTDCRAGSVPSPIVYDGIREDDFFRSSVSLWHARWLTQHRLYDEALQMLETLNPDRVSDPATFLFCRAVCQQQLLDAAAARDSLTLLLNHTANIPQRYRATGEMMQEALEGWSDDGLPQVARVMNDVERRLDLGRSGDPTQEQEERVISLIDKLLEDMEKQQQQQQQGGQGGSSQSQGNQPGTEGATESQVKGTTGEGVADRRELDESGTWGLLDQQSEARARELIRQQFPSNFLDAISRYIQKIAESK